MRWKLYDEHDNEVHGSGWPSGGVSTEDAESGVWAIGGSIGPFSRVSLLGEDGREFLSRHLPKPKEAEAGTPLRIVPGKDLGSVAAPTG